MDIISKAINRVFRRKDALGYVDFPDIEGTDRIFKTFLDLDGSWGMTKRLNAYRKSLYVFACVFKIAQKTGAIDLELYKITNTDGDKEQIFVHPLLDLLYRPNPYQTKEFFIQKYMINKKLAGCNFVLKVRKNGPGSEIVELWNLRPDLMRILIDDNNNIKGYEFNVNGKPVTFAPEDIIYDAYPDSLSDWQGISALQPAQARVDTETFATDYQRNFFVNNARPDFVLMSERKIGNDQKEDIKEAWDKRHKGAKNVGKGAFLEAGLKFQQVSITQREMDYIESLKMTRDDILVAFQTPKVILSITEDVNLANAETGMQIYLAETIVPEIRTLTNKLNEDIVYSEFSPLLFIDYVDPVPENRSEKADIQGKRLTAGTMLINEAREEWGDEPVVGGWSLYMPVSNVPIGGLPQGNSAEKAYKARIQAKKAAEKRKIFNGRSLAYKILGEKNRIKGEMYKAIMTEVKASKEVKRTPFIKAEMRKQYADVVVKSIDAKGDSMEKPINGFMSDQEERAKKVISNHAKTMTKGLGSELKQALSVFEKDEAKVFAEFSIPYIDDFVKSAGKQALQSIAPAEEFDETGAVEKFIKDRAKALGKQVLSTTVDNLSRTLAEGLDDCEGLDALTERVSAVYSEFPIFRSKMIARTEATAANNRGFVEGYRQSGVANAKEWISIHDSRTREEHVSLDGEIVDLDSSFSNGLSYPGDPSGDPAETVNCRCVLGPAFQE